ncbi:MAG: PAS domain S-box-containing protein/diguanylate cyclase (GGDEF) domain-containing protein [Candidatus Electronema aureum]|uniref:PAS domain S-box-containing protein/diguanylate cyclase (GGDEF) domain-containing protein n=1 Tax=Candidatus Electronema aureum TaxID=2005002 RepID=A0A521G0G9_9BACT|nr:MAG: PAS domain S-box-containing protein/diguanylate cyclase (GGDEF) domain-containing protein [Candidatus Electronema aureum]
MNNQNDDKKPKRNVLLIGVAVLLGAFLPTGAAFVLHCCIGSWRFIHEPLAAMLLGWTAVTAILSSLFIMLTRHTEGNAPRTVWIAAALAGMGVLDGFNAGGTVSSIASVWLYSTAALVGGLLFTLHSLPERIARHPLIEWLPCLTATLCSLPGTGFLLSPALIPPVASLAVAKIISISGGLCFFIAGLHFLRESSGTEKRDALLIAGCSLFFASAACFFPFTLQYGAVWWLWHVLRLAAFFALLCLFLTRCRDNIQQLSRHRDDLAVGRKQLADLIENSPSAVTLKDISGRYVLVNRRFEELFGIKKKDVIGKFAADILPKLTRKLSHDSTESETVIEYEESISSENGTRTFLTSCFALPGSGEFNGCVGCIQTDITERRKLEQQLRLDQKIIENAEEAVVVTDAKATILDVNEAYTFIMGYERDEAIGQNPRICKSGHHDQIFYEEMWRQLTETGSWSGEIWDRRKNGEVFEKWLTISAIRDSSGNTVNYVGIFNDITEKKNIERKLKNLLFYDPLTKLPNRTLFQEHLEQAMISSQSHDIPLALFCIDLDRFKDVNDSLGHKAGDELLTQVAKRIRSGVRKSDVVARLCGDEFTVILSEIKFCESAGHLARRMIHLLQQPFHIDGEEIFINASIGISIYPDDGLEAETLIKNADTAMHFAKQREQGSFQHFRTQMNEQLVQRLNLEKQLRHALDDEQFVLYYQPKYSLPDEKMVGSEALVRWLHPEEGIISPAEFIPLAEETGLITALGEWSLKTACRQAKDWEAQGLGLHRVAVNLSSRQFQNRKLLDLLRDTLAETGLPAAFLELEITESTVMENPKQAVELLQEIRQIGIRIAIDDFGTGYSSLAYLKKFPVNSIKIDQSFIADLTKDSDDAAIVASIIQMARSLNLEVVAEGVETLEQLDFLREKKCHEVQGYYFSKPLPVEQFAEKIRSLQSS